MQQMEPDDDNEDFSEIETTEDEFNAMWESAEPVETIVHRPVSETVTVGVRTRTTVTRSWAPNDDDVVDGTSSANARIA